LLVPTTSLLLPIKMGNAVNGGDVLDAHGGHSVADYSATDSYTMAITTYDSKEYSTTEESDYKLKKKGRRNHIHSKNNRNKKSESRISRERQEDRDHRQESSGGDTTDDYSNTEESYSHEKDDRNVRDAYLETTSRREGTSDPRHNHGYRSHDVTDNSRAASAIDRPESPYHYQETQAAKPKLSTTQRAEYAAAAAIPDIAPMDSDMALNGSQEEMDTSREEIANQSVPITNGSLLESLKLLEEEEKILEKKLADIESNESVKSHSDSSSCSTLTVTVLSQLNAVVAHHSHNQEHDQSQLEKEEFETLEAKTPERPKLEPPESKSLSANDNPFSFTGVVAHHSHNQEQDQSQLEKEEFKTLETKTPERPKLEPPESKSLSANDNPLSFTGSREHPIVIEDVDPAPLQVEELLKQQQLQEQKLKQQLDELRLQKEKLQFLQSEVARQSRHKEVQAPQNQLLRHTNRQKEDYGDDKNIIERLDRVRQSRHDTKPQMTHYEDDDSPVVLLQQGEDFQSLEDKYAGDEEIAISVFDSLGGAEESQAGTRKDKMDELALELDNVPIQRTIDIKESSSIKEMDLTIISDSSADAFGKTDEAERNGLTPIEEDQEVIGALSHAMSNMDDEIDLEFVAKYEAAFNAFLDAHTILHNRDPGFIQNLKIVKLQRILEASYQMESDLEMHLESQEWDAKATSEEEIVQKLREASSKKATRNIQLESDLSHLRKQEKIMEGKMTMDVIVAAINRSSRISAIRANLKNKDLKSRESLVMALPDAQVKKVVETPAQELTGETRKQKVRQHQIDTAVFSAEAKMLQGKVETLREAVKRESWIDAVLVHVDDRKLRKLKVRYEKKLGVSF